MSAAAPTYVRSVGRGVDKFALTLPSSGTAVAPRGTPSRGGDGAFTATISFKMFPKRGNPEKEDGFTIAKARNEDTGAEIVMKGKYGPVVEGQLVKVLRSKLQHDSRYGDYVQVFAVSHEDPKTREAVVHYLQNLPGVGEKIAEAIVDHLGPECLSRIDDNPNLLTQIRVSGRGIKPEDLEEVMEKWDELRAERKNLLYFSSIGIGDATGRKIANHFAGMDVEKLVAQDPYVIAQVKGVGFKIADRVATKMGIRADDPRRAAAGVEYLLSSAENEGHICLTREQIYARGPRLLARAGNYPDIKVLEDGLARMIDDGRLYSEVDPSDDVERIYTAEHYMIETRLYAHIEDRITGEPKELPSGLEYKDDMLVTEEQFKAVKHAFGQRLSILTGAAGCGKTTALKEIITQAEREGLSVTCLAPTGKAAKRMKESTGRPASTLHRQLGFQALTAPITAYDQPPENQMLSSDLVIVDEASMLDMRMAERLLTHVRPEAHVVFVGDPNQLPAIGAGSVLHDLIESDRVATTKLTKIFRQAEDSLLVVNANRIRKGDQPFWSREEAEAALGHSVRDDWVFVEESDPEEALAKVLKFSDKLPEELGIAEEDVMVTAPTKKGGVGVHMLNRAMQRKHNPDGTTIRETKTDKEGETHQELRVGDIAMNTVNRYGAKDKPDVMNGDQGLITRFDAEKKTVWVDFGFDKEVAFSGEEISSLIPAYAATTHKLQGSEAPAIICPIAGAGGDRLLTRNLLYTAWTRGKEKCVVIGDKAKILEALGRDGTKRQTTLDLRVGRVMPRIKARWGKVTGVPLGEIKTPVQLLYG